MEAATWGRMDGAGGADGIDPPADSLQSKKQLIQALTRRLFNHVEHGINIPGKRLDEARRA